MRPMESFLRAAGYRILNLDYPSRRHDLAGLADIVTQQLAAAGAWDAPKLHFVTHSMGGLVARHLLGGRPPHARIGRVLLLAPPSAGSEVADFLAPLPPYRWLYGPAGQQLTSRYCSDAWRTKPDFELGIIAGATGWPYLLGTLLLPRPHDGRVSVERTRVDGMRDHLVVRATHSFIMRGPEVQRQVLQFIRHGGFARQVDGRAEPGAATGSAAELQQ
ncbi:hypothetical protein VW23_020485 [Devosia insulae DS-56]|uniref:AB hydrolase-1 domain-containing protein n=2 Tax=Devosia insulae TaxID=408174 RepID=A0A1E5XPT1_9HYPH|nr:hypothetical protein VW23_020485 [Devosia insulae DS-56]